MTASTSTSPAPDQRHEETKVRYRARHERGPEHHRRTEHISVSFVRRLAPSQPLQLQHLPHGHHPTGSGTVHSGQSDVKTTGHRNARTQSIGLRARRSRCGISRVHQVGVAFYVRPGGFGLGCTAAIVLPAERVVFFAPHWPLAPARALRRRSKLFFCQRKGRLEVQEKGTRRRRRKYPTKRRHFTVGGLDKRCRSAIYPADTLLTPVRSS